MAKRTLLHKGHGAPKEALMYHYYNKSIDSTKLMKHWCIIMVLGALIKTSTKTSSCLPFVGPSRCTERGVGGGG